MISLTAGPYPAADRRPEFLLPPSDAACALVFAAAGAKRCPIPAGATYIVFAATVDFWVRYGDANVAATVPVSDILDGSAALLNAAGHTLPDGAKQVGVAVAAAGTVNLLFFGP